MTTEKPIICIPGNLQFKITYSIFKIISYLLQAKDYVYPTKLAYLVLGLTSSLVIYIPNLPEL